MCGRRFVWRALYPFPRGDLKYIDIYRCMLSHAYLYKLLFVYRFLFVVCP